MATTGLVGSTRSEYAEIILGHPAGWVPSRTDVQYRILIGWGQHNASGFFRVGTSTLAPGDHAFGYDVLAPEFTPFNPNYDYDPNSDVTDVATELTITRGRQALGNAVDMGVCEMTLYDPTEKYNAYNTASPLYGSIREMRPALVLFTDDGFLWHIVFNGWMAYEDTDYDVGRKVAKLRFNDLFIWLGRSASIFVHEETGPIYVGDAIGLVLDCIGFTDPNFRELDRGGLLPRFSMDGSKSGTQVIADLIQVDLGVFFATRRGVARYVDRWSPYHTEPTITVPYAVTTVPALDYSKIFTRATVTREGGVAQTYIGEKAQNEFGPIDASAISSVYLIDDNQALSLASEIVARSQEPSQPIYTFQTTELAQPGIDLILAEIGTCITSADPVTPGNFIIEQIVHRAVAGMDHRCNWVLSRKSDRLPFWVGYGTLAPSDNAAGYPVLVY